MYCRNLLLGTEIQGVVGFPVLTHRCDRKILQRLLPVFALRKGEGVVVAIHLYILPVGKLKIPFRTALSGVVLFLGGTAFGGIPRAPDTTHLQDKGNRVRAGVVQIILVVYPNLLHVQGGRLQLILNVGFLIALRRIGSGIGGGFISSLSVRSTLLNLRRANVGFDAAIVPKFSILILFRQVGEGVLPGVAPGVLLLIICGELDGDDIVSLLIFGHAGQSDPLLCGLVIGAEAWIPRDFLPCCAIFGSLQNHRDTGGAQAVLVVAVHPVFPDVVGAAKAVGQIVHLIRAFLPTAGHRLFGLLVALHG